jgi:hypothetical protein
MSFRFRHAICNEVYKDWISAAQVDPRHRLRRHRNRPFTLAEDLPAIPCRRRRECRAVIEGEGLEFVGLTGWSPRKVHVTTPDLELRRKAGAMLAV